VKYSNLRAFEKHIVDAAPNHFADLYLILSQDSFQRKQISDRLLSSALNKELHSDLNHQFLDASTNSVEVILEELSSYSFFSKKRGVLIQNLDKASKHMLEKLEMHLTNLNPSILLILTSASLSASTKLYKKIEKVGIILDLAEAKSWEKEKIAQEELISKIAQNKKRIHPSASLFLVKLIGTNPATLHQELEKLLCYIGEREEITIQDITTICTNTNTASIWQLGEAIFKREAAAAFRISKALLEEGNVFLALLRQLRSQFETGYQICCMIAQGNAPSDVTQQFPYMKGAILERHLQQAKAYGLPNFKKGLLKIDEIELKAKNSGIESEILNELLIASLIT
jgi:DNA polymerase III subunit delta